MHENSEFYEGLTMRTLDAASEHFPKSMANVDLELRKAETYAKLCEAAAIRESRGLHNGA